MMLISFPGFSEMKIWNVCAFFVYHPYGDSSIGLRCDILMLLKNLSDDKQLQLTALKVIEQFNPPGIVCFELFFLLTSIFQPTN